MTETTLSNQEIQDLIKEKPKTEQNQKLVEAKTKLTAVNEMRKQAGLDKIDNVNDMTVQDKRGWLILQDLWRKNITHEHATEVLEGIYGNKNDQTDGQLV